jgi:hypothetical protein
VGSVPCVRGRIRQKDHPARGEQHCRDGDDRLDRGDRLSQQKGAHGNGERRVDDRHGRQLRSHTEPVRGLRQHHAGHGQAADRDPDDDRDEAVRRRIGDTQHDGLARHRRHRERHTTGSGEPGSAPGAGVTAAQQGGEDQRGQGAESGMRPAVEGGTGRGGVDDQQEQTESAQGGRGTLPLTGGHPASAQQGAERQREDERERPERLDHGQRPVPQRHHV